MIAINVTLPGGEQFSIDSLFVKLISNEYIEDTPTDFELEMSLAEVVPNQGSQRSSTHSRPVLGPGYGLKDWIRFNRRSQDLSGTLGEEKRITPSELAKHCTEEDAWTAINGRFCSTVAFRSIRRTGRAWYRCSSRSANNLVVYFCRRPRIQHDTLLEVPPGRCGRDHERRWEGLYFSLQRSKPTAINC